VYDANAQTNGTKVKLIADDKSQLQMTGDSSELTSNEIRLTGETSTEVEGGGGRAVFSGGRASMN
jgi:hypothetical protein